MSCAGVFPPVASPHEGAEVVAVASCSNLPSPTTCQNEVQPIPRIKGALLSLLLPPESPASTQHLGTCCVLASREVAAACLSSWVLLAAPCPPSAMKQLPGLPPAWLEFGSLLTHLRDPHVTSCLALL